MSSVIPVSPYTKDVQVKKESNRCLALGFLLGCVGTLTFACLFAWQVTKEDASNNVTLSILGYQFQEFVSVPTAEHFNRISKDINLEFEIDYTYDLSSNIPSYVNATSLSTFHAVLAPTYYFTGYTGGVPNPSIFFPLDGYPFSIPMNSLLTYVESLGKQHWETIISNNSDYSEVRVIAPCGVVPGESAMWSKVNLSDPNSEANMTGNMRARGIAGTLMGRAIPSLNISQVDNFTDGNGDDKFIEYASPSLDAVYGFLQFSETYNEPLFYYTGRPITTGATTISMMVPKFVYETYEDELRAYCSMLNGKVSESLYRDEYYLDLFRQNGVNVEPLPTWMFDRLEVAYNDYLANDADDDLRIAEAAMDNWYISTGFTQYV